MGVGNLPHICKQLMDHGRDKHTPVALVQWGTTKYQRTVTGTLATIEEIAKKAEIAHPAIVLVGEVVTIREKIKWFEERAENILL